MATILNRRLLLGAAVAAPPAVLLAGAFAAPTPQPAPSIGKGRFPNVTLTTHHGKQVRFYDDVIRGNKINIINMMYTQCPDVCGGALVNMARAQKLLGERMGREVFMYSITLDPKQDTPKVLARHAELVGAGPGWTFLTGQEADVQRLRRALGFVDIDPVVDRDLRAHRHAACGQRFAGPLDLVSGLGACPTTGAVGAVDRAGCRQRHQEYNSMDAQGPQLASEFFRQKGLDYLEAYHDPDARLMRALGVFGLPVSVVIDRKGRVAATIQGEVDWNAADMRALLAKV